MHLYYDQWQNMQCSFKYFEQCILEITTCDPSIYIIGHPYLTVSNLIGTLVQKGYNSLLIETVLLSTHNVCFGC